MTSKMTAADYKAIRKKRVDREGPVQIEIVKWLRSVLPDGCLVTHVRNEIKRGGWTYAKEQDRARQLGTIAGWPDLLVVTYAGVLFLEVKARRGATSKVQKHVHAELAHLGHRVAVVRSVAEVRACLVDWSIGFVENVELRGVVS